jgi:hypothetical protein
MSKAQIRWNAAKSKYELVAKGKVLVTSKNQNYFNYLIVKGVHPAIIKNKITEVEVISQAPDTPITMTDVDGKELARPTYSITERFDFMEQMINMVINKTAKSIFVTGEGGIGKSYTVLKCLEKAGKVDVNEVVSAIEILSITPDDTEGEMKLKALACINKPKGDFIVVKGHSSAASLYRTLYEHKDKTIIFDDCDSVFKDVTGCGLLKSALDSYEDRWVHWRVERAGDHDLPMSFKFKGSIVFISNLPLAKVDEAIKTRCLKVDLSMTKAQRIERMQAVIANICPDVHVDMKLEALKLLSDNMHLTNDVNFRSLMNVIAIRSDVSVKNWQELAKYALTEQ